MRQVINVSYAAQMESLSDEKAVRRWQMELNRLPSGYLLADHRRGQSVVSAELDRLMPVGEA